MAHQRIVRWFRLSLMFFGMFLAFDAFVYSNAMNLRRSAPQTAYSLYRDNAGVIAARYNDLAVKGEKRDITEGDRLELEKALRAEPLNRMLVRSLAIWYDLNRQPKMALAGMQIASAVSRRDVLTQLWLVEYRLREAKSGRAYRHIDVALKVRPQLASLLYPRLATLMADPLVSANVALSAKSDTRWVPGLADYLVEQDLSAAYTLLNSPSVRAKSTSYTSAFRSLAHNLARSGSIDRARTIAETLVSSKQYDQWADFGLNRLSGDPDFGNLSWLSNTDYASLVPTEREQLELQVSVPSDQTVELMGRGIFLLPGAGYQIEGTIKPGSDLRDTQLQWIMACWRNSGEERYFAGKLPPLSTSGQFSLTFRVPDQCPYTKVVLQALGGSSGIPAEFTLQSLKLKRVELDADERRE